MIPISKPPQKAPLFGIANPDHGAAKDKGHGHPGHGTEGVIIDDGNPNIPHCRLDRPGRLLQHGKVVGLADEGVSRKQQNHGNHYRGKNPQHTCDFVKVQKGDQDDQG